VALNNRQSLYWWAFKVETGLLELQDTGILTFETLQILARSECGSGDCGSGLQGRRDRWRKDLSPWLEAWHHAWTTGDDSTAQRDRASYRSHEDGWQTRSELAQRCTGRCNARGAVRRCHNLRMILRKLRFFYAFLLALLLNSAARVGPQRLHHRPTKPIVQGRLLSRPCRSAYGPVWLGDAVCWRAIELPERISI
jgi:hypothetical protein